MTTGEADFETVDSREAEAISVLARDIWQRHYWPEILTRNELDYFWQRSYTPSRLREDMRNGARYEWIKTAGQRVGFLAYRMETGEGRLHLSKLYLDPDFHGLGLGAKALSRVQHLATAEGIREIYLYVFRNNAKAVRAYQRAGFVIERTEMTECGVGYRYDDYVMVCRVTPESFPIHR